MHYPPSVYAEESNAALADEIRERSGFATATEAIAKVERLYTRGLITRRERREELEEIAFAFRVEIDDEVVLRGGIPWAPVSEQV